MQRYSRFRRIGRPLLSVLSCAAVMLGCGEGDTRSQAPLHAQQTVDAGLSPACDFAGTWAMEFRIPVSWRSSAGLQGGEGEIVQWSISERAHLCPGAVVDYIRPCGSAVPGYRAQRLFGGTLYGTRFPDSLFDQDFFDGTELKTTIFEDGTQYRSEPWAIELGVAMPHPLDDLWPSRSEDVLALALDQDRDGHPGITVDVDAESADGYPPLGMLLARARHAQKFFVATRNIASSAGKVVNCDRFEGTATIPIIEGRAALHSTILGCETTTGELCTQAETRFVSKWQPEYQVLGGSRATLVRVPAGSTCRDVRGLDFSARLGR